MLNPDQIAKAIEYNKKQAGTLWKITDLPAELQAARSADTAVFAEAVADAQVKKGIKSDGMLGPSTLAALVPPKSVVTKDIEGKAAAALILVCEAEANKGAIPAANAA